MSGTLPLRVMVQDAWEEVDLEVPETTTVQDLKRQALAGVRILRDPDQYVVKYRGAQLVEEDRSLAQHHLVPNANLIVLGRRRRPVR